MMRLASRDSWSMQGHFVANRQNLVIGFSDQVPVWAKVPTGKQMFLKDEVQTKDMKQKRGLAMEE